jgi:hypothetical protein
VEPLTKMRMLSVLTARNTRGFALLDTREH